MQDQQEFRCIESNAYKYEGMFQVAVFSVAVHFITCFHTGVIPYWQKLYSDLVGHVFFNNREQILFTFIKWVLADGYGLDCVT